MPMKKITNDDLVYISNQEEKLKFLLNLKRTLLSPKKETLDTIINYSISTSIYVSKNLGAIKINLN
jgi:hypothetical protein